MVFQPEKTTLKALLTGPLRSTWIIIFVIALLSRFIFLSFVPQLPVFWDARLYVSAAIGLLGYVDRQEPYAAGSAADADFDQYYTKYISGEKIDWLYYSPPTLPEAQKYLFYSGPVYPAIMALIFSLPGDNDFQMVRWFNAFVDSVGIVLLCMVAFLIWNRRSAVWIVAVMQLLYIPSILTCGILGLETITSFFIALLLFILCLYDRSENRWLAAGAGLVGGILFLTKPTAAVLTLPVFVYFLVRHCHQRRQLRQAAVYYLAPFMLMALPWTIFTSNYYGRPAIRDPEYAAANLRSSSSIPFEGYDLDHSEPNFWTYSVVAQIAEHPLEYINLLSKKLIRLWWQPHDEFHQGPQWFDIAFHRALVIASLLGLAGIARSRPRYLLLPALIVLYYTGIHLILHSVARYNFNALPGLFLLAAGFALFAIDGKKPVFTRKKSEYLIAGIVMLLLISSPFWGEFILWHLGMMAIIGIIILLLVAAGLYYRRLLFPPDKLGIRQIAIWAPVVILSITAITAWSRDGSREWSVSLTDTQSSLITEITLPPDFQVAADDNIQLALDLTTTTSQYQPVRISLNGQIVIFKDGQPPVDKDFYIKGTYGAFESVMGLDRRLMRWYRTFPLTPANMNIILGGKNKLQIAASLDSSSTSGAMLRLYGDPGSPDQKEMRLPSFTHNSIERFKELDDRRIPETYRISSLDVHSYVSPNDHNSGNTQLPLPDNLHGRFRVYLIVKRSDFSTLYF